MAESCTVRGGDKWEVYPDNASEWRWRRTAPNGRIVGASSEGYASKFNCLENARRNGMTCTPV